jgi:hypothetical protein
MEEHMTVLHEYLGNIATEALMQNLTNTNEPFGSIDSLRFSRLGFTVVAETEHDEVCGKRLVRIVLEPQ